MSTNPIHLMNLEEAEQTLTRYNTILNVRNSETNRLNHQIDLINDDTPDLKDCIRILIIRIKELEAPHKHNFKEISKEDKRDNEVYGICKCGQTIKAEL